MNKFVKLLLCVGIFASTTASLCCIMPLLAVIFGTSISSSVFSWLNPFRPYIIGVSIIMLIYAWYLKLKPVKKIDCHCETEEKSNFLHSKRFLGLATGFIITMLLFPYYSNVIHPFSENKITGIPKSNFQHVEFSISGMTSALCSGHVDRKIIKLKGIKKASVLSDSGKAIVEFDNTITNVAEIEKAINSSGYPVTAKKEK